MDKPGHAIMNGGVLCHWNYRKWPRLSAPFLFALPPCNGGASFGDTWRDDGTKNAPYATPDEPHSTFDPPKGTLPPECYVMIPEMLFRYERTPDGTLRLRSAKCIGHFVRLTSAEGG